MDSIIWAIKHTMRDIADLGLNCEKHRPISPDSQTLTANSIVCLEVINNFASADAAIGNGFFQAYFTSIVQDIFFVLTDTDHKSGFKLQSMLLARMFQLVETSVIQTPLFNPAEMPDPSITNAQYLTSFCENLLKTAFPHVQK